MNLQLHGASCSFTHSFHSVIINKTRRRRNKAIRLVVRWAERRKLLLLVDAHSGWVSINQSITPHYSHRAKVKSGQAKPMRQDDGKRRIHKSLRLDFSFPFKGPAVIPPTVRRSDSSRQREEPGRQAHTV